MAGKRRRLTAQEEAILAAAEKLREAGRDPGRILNLVLKWPDAVPRAATLYSAPLRSTMTVLPWDRKQPGRPRAPKKPRARPGRPRTKWEEPLADYAALQKAGKPVKVARREVAKRHRPDLASSSDRELETWFQNLREARRRARRRQTTK